MTEETQPIEAIKADDYKVKTKRTLELDMELISFIHSKTYRGQNSIRQTEILNAEPFRLISPSTLRRHLHDLTVKGILDCPTFRGDYKLRVGGYQVFNEEVLRVTEMLLGKRWYEFIRDAMKR
jgi:hypothetical protein